MYVKPQFPNGVNRPHVQDRMPVVRVVNGDTWMVELTICNPMSKEPATDANTRVRFVLSENRFTFPIWTGRWHEGVEPSSIVPGLVHVIVPKAVSSALRRGVYAFSMRVEDPTGTFRETQATGHFQVEYEPSSDLHEIPYRPGTSGSPAGGQFPDLGDAVYVHRGTVQRFDDLPPDPYRGDVWSVTEPVGAVPGGTNWVWTGNGWDALGGEITPEDIESAIEAGGYSVIKFDENDNPYVVRVDGDSLEDSNG